MYLAAYTMYYLASYAMYLHHVAACIMQTKASWPPGYYYVYGNNRGVAPAVLPTVYSLPWGRYRIKWIL